MTQTRYILLFIIGCIVISIGLWLALGIGYSILFAGLVITALSIGGIVNMQRKKDEKRIRDLFAKNVEQINAKFN